MYLQHHLLLRKLWFLKVLLVPDIKVKGKSSWQIYQKSDTVQEQLFYEFIQIKKIIISENNKKKCSLIEKEN